MLNDDFQVGRILTRREALLLLGIAGAASIAGCPTTSTDTSGGAGSTGSTTDSGGGVGNTTGLAACVVRPAETEGPYFVDEKLNRADITTDPTTGVAQAGIPFVLAINASKINGSSCEPLAGAQVDIWHASAAGVYSDESANGTGGEKWLRGYLLTDANGQAKFTTIYPGWYQGRTAHIHFKIRMFSGSTKTYEFTSQLFFDDALNDQVYSQAPYNTRGTRGTRNSNDSIYNSQLLLDPAALNGGYSADFDIGLNVS